MKESKTYFENALKIFEGKDYFNMNLVDLIQEKVRLSVNKDKASSNLGKVDALLNDCSHVLELGNLSGSEMLKLASKQRNILKERRFYKDVIASIDKIIAIVGTLINLKSERKYNFRIVKDKVQLLGMSTDELLDKAKLKELV